MWQTHIVRVFSKETLQVAQGTFAGAVTDLYEGAESKLECM